MKLLIAKLALVALIATPLVSSAQNHLAPADRNAQLTLLPGPRFLSPANATGEVVPGQAWTLLTKTGAPKRPATGTLSLRSSSDLNLTFGAPRAAPIGTRPANSGTTTLTISAGNFTFTPASGAPKEKESFDRQLKPVPTAVSPELLRFDSKLPQLNVAPLQKKPPASEPAPVKSPEATR